MQRLRLTGTVSITGLDVLGKRSTLTIAPITDQTDYRWFWDIGGGVPITPDIFRVGGLFGRCVALVHNDRIFHEFEHIAFLHTLGLRGVSVRLEDSTWPPFMCQAELRRQMRFLLIPQTPLKPYTPAAKIFPSKTDLYPGKKGMGEVSYSPDRTQDLLLRAQVDYGDGRVGSHELAFSSGVEEQDLVEVLSARTLGKPHFLRWLARAASHLPQWREQSKKVVWRPRHISIAFYHELAMHKVLDGALLSFAAPSNSFLAGTVEFYRSPHGLDLKLVRELYPHDNVMEFRKSA